MIYKTFIYINNPKNYHVNIYAVHVKKNIENPINQILVRAYKNNFLHTYDLLLNTNLFNNFP